MTIGADGTINISDLAGSYSGGRAVVVVDDNGNLSADDSNKSIDEIVTEMQMVKAENEALRTELKELREMVEALLSE